MTIREIITYPDERLRTIAKPVKQVDHDIKTLVDDMLETMYDANGIGLAATQVDVHLQVIVMDISEERNSPLVLINPKITKQDGEQIYDEGCLSVPEYYAPVKRAETITITALDEQGEIFELSAEGLLAICIQHEMDHLAGKVFVDYLSRLKQDRVRKKLIKMSKI
ncbi:MAG: peptide deformylase [Arenicella sp.]|jgi:peptide deformylase|nr:peptide deformylase [Arenicella sp.]HAU68245.1 peptide deformylase [Gammaproteobacteria bacterium]